jgi:hypothetical protein
LCAEVVITGVNAPDAVHELKSPVSKPPFLTTFGSGVYAVTATSSRSAYVGSVG